MVSKLRVYNVFAAVNRVVSLAVRATNVAVVSLNVYSPIRAKVRLTPAVLVVPIVIALTVTVVRGVKKA